MSSSSSNPRWLYDVLLHFKVEETRGSFVSHLYAALANAGIHTLMDEGQEVWRPIEESHVALVVFTKNYARSARCLDVLEKIVDCHFCYGQVVVPVFYGVDPRDVRDQTGAFGKSLEELAEKRLGGNGMLDLLFRWGRILTQATRFIGWNFGDYRDEAEFVKKIVHDVLEKLDDALLSITQFPVGLESRVQEVIGFIKNQSSKVCIVGFRGMGGSGKTTTAKAIYNQIQREFENRSFIENIRQFWENDNRGYIHLQKQLLSDILKTDTKIHLIGNLRTMIHGILQSKRFLVVLDDLTEYEQIEALLGNARWMGSGSVLIVTTRDVRLLHLLGVDCVFEMKGMDENESLELFSWHAFNQASPTEKFSKISREIVTYCEGLPLTLEVLGSYLYERTHGEWKSVLSKLKKIPNYLVIEKLKISYDDLDDGEKNVFLDICCFFVGKNRAYVTEILSECGFCPKIEIAVLVERNLIKIEKCNKLAMHDLLRYMGTEIICQSSKKPEKRSRLGAQEDVLDVFTRHAGTKAIEGLALKLERTSEVRLDSKEFEKMSRLRLLKFNDVQILGDYKYLPKQLRCIEWQGFRSEHIPNNFDLKNLVAIDLQDSNIRQVWKEPQFLEKLKYLNLSHSRYLIRTPDFSNLPNLEKLVLKDCPRLFKIHRSVGVLRNIVVMNLRDCTSLSNLPRKIYQLKSLKSLILSGCSKIDKLEEEIVQMESLTTLIAKNTIIKEVPHSIVRSKSIGYISLCGYEGLARNVFPSLIWSWMAPTMNSLSHIHPSWDMSSSRVSMNVQNNNLGVLAATLSSLSKLRGVWVQCQTYVQFTQQVKRILDNLYDENFTELETSSYVPQVSDQCLRILFIGMGSYHKAIDTLAKSVSQGLAIGVSSDVLLPGDNYPYWLTQIGEGHSVIFKVPRVSDHRMKGMALCVVYSSTQENVTAECLVSVLILNYTKYTVQIYKRETAFSFNDEDWQGIISNLEPDDKVEILVAFGHGFTVKKTAVYLICDESIDVRIQPYPKLKKMRLYDL